MAFKVKELWNKRRKTTIIVMGVFVAIIVLSSMRYRALNPPQEPSQEEKTLFELNLSDEQLNRINSYSADELRVLDLLTKSLWADSAGTQTVQFHKEYFTELNGNTEQPVVFIITNYKAISEKTTSTNTEGWLLNMTVAGKDQFLEVTRTQGKSLLGELTEFSVWKLTSAAFVQAKEYFYAAPLGGFDPPEISKQFLELTGKKLTDVQATIENFCAKYYPTTSAVVWNKQVVLDSGNNTISAKYALGSATTGTIVLVFNTGTGELTVERGK